MFLNTVRIVILLCVMLSWDSAFSAEPNRPFSIYKMDEVGLEVWVPERPKWIFQVEDRPNNVTALILNTPELYYPNAAIEIILNKNITVERKDLRTTSKAAMSEIRRSSGVLSPAQAVERVRYGDIEGYQDQFDVEYQGKPYTIQSIVGMFSTGQVVSLLVTTPKGQVEHIEVMKAKIFRKLSIL